jgi:hypothetical protein
MHPPDCPGWEYGTHPNRAVLPSRVSSFLVALVSGAVDTSAIATDTRLPHERIFTGLTPNGCEYYAGHYRGEPFRCLRLCPVHIPSDPRVGRPPSGVLFLMEELRSEIRAGLAALDANVLLTTEERLKYLVAFASHVFVAFLTIHPFANGNGHAGRLIVWSVLGRYGHWPQPQNWPVEPRPADPPYSKLIVEHRNGNTEPLESFLLQILIAPSA